MPRPLPLPPALPPHASTLLPWLAHQVARTARRLDVDAQDVWDEATTALLRAAVHFRPGAGTFEAYARTSITRGLWRYVARASLRRARALGPWVPLLADTLTSPSAEAEAIARETARTHSPRPAAHDVRRSRSARSA